MLYADKKITSISRLTHITFFYIITHHINMTNEAILNMVQKIERYGLINMSHVLQHDRDCCTTHDALKGCWVKEQEEEGYN